MSRVVPRFSRSSTSLAVILTALFSGSYAGAQTTITGANTTPAATSSTGDLTIAAGGSITLASQPNTAAITIDSNNMVTIAGSATVNDSNNATGILAVGGFAGSITFGGTIDVTDSVPATVLPLTAGENRYGIQITGASPFTGTITSEAGGSISVVGNDSAGIYINNTGGLASSAAQTGSITVGGGIAVTGNSSYGILTTANAPLSGGISITGSVTVLGSVSQASGSYISPAASVGSSAIQLNGTVGGQLYIDGTVSADGYYFGYEVTSRPTSFTGISAKNYAQSGPAVSILNNITGGILVDTAGVVTSYGSSPAIQIAPLAGGTAEIGVVAAGSYGLLINGAVNANGIFDTFGANTIQIGQAGNGAGTAIIDTGINIASTGSVTATAYAANSTAISFLGGASVGTLVNSGTIKANVLFGLGSNAATGGTATAIYANGGALGAITNYGNISATTASGSAYALDLRGDTTLVTVNQDPSGTTTPSSITGDILFGPSGAALNLNSGILAGAVSFGGSTANALSISNGAVLAGALTQATGGELALNVANGQLTSTSTSNLALSTLTLGSSGQINFAVNPTTGQNGSVTVVGGGVGAVMISSGAKIGLDLDSQLTKPETFTVVQTTGAATLVGQPIVSPGDIAYFYTSNVVTDTTAGTITLGLVPRAFAQAGVGGTASAYNAIFAANYADPGIRDSFNAAGTQPGFKRLYQQMLPSYSGGLFEVLAQGADAVARAEAGNSVVEGGKRGGGWAQQIGFGGVDSGGSSPGYHGGGLGFAFGWEAPASPISTWGVSVSYLRASVDDFDTGPKDQEVGTVYSAGLYWREVDGGFRTDASVNAGVAEMNGERNFLGTDLTGAAVSRTADATWDGGIAEAHLGLSYEQPIGDFFIKPTLSGDYFVLYEGSRTEHNGGSGFDLKIASATSTQGSVVGGLIFGTQFGDKSFLWRPEIMIGYKQVFGGADTVAAEFAGGSSFSVAPAGQQGGPIAHVAIHGGNKYSDFAFEAGGEDRGDYTGLDGRITARFKF